MTRSGTHTGRCQCGDVTFEIDAEPMMAGQCHCRDCQRSSGTGHVNIVGFPRTAVRVTGTTATFQSLADSGATVTRSFCPRCGSRLFGATTSMPDMLTVNAGVLDDMSAYRAQMTVYAKRRPAWDPVAEGVPVFEAMPPMPSK